jgi:hypothetical protein
MIWIGFIWLRIGINSGLLWTRYYIGCLFCMLIRRLELIIGRHCYLLTNWRSCIRWSSDQWVSRCYAIMCDRSFYCALFCVFMTRVSQCPISLCPKHPIYTGSTKGDMFHSWHFLLIFTDNFVLCSMCVLRRYRGGRAVWGMKYLCPFKHWCRRFEFLWRHGFLSAFIMCLCCHV